MSGLLRQGRATARAVGTAIQVVRSSRRMRGSDPQQREAARRRLAELLGEGSGLGRKVHQALRLEADTAQPSRDLHFADVRELVPDELGARIAKIKERGLGASIAQVHHARFHDGRDVALKFLRPGIREALRAELRLLSMVPKVGVWRRLGFDLDGYRGELARVLGEELDLVGEAERQDALRTDLRDLDIVIPEVIRPYSGPDVLVQSWEPSELFSSIRNDSRRARSRLMSALTRAQFRGLFRTGRLHADLHEGNLGIRRDDDQGRLVLYDHGCVATVDESVRRAWGSLILARVEGRGIDDAACLERAGFDRTTLEFLGEDLARLIDLLCEPFTADVEHWNLRQRMNDCLGEARWAFRAAAPPEHLLVLRALAALPRLCERLSIPLGWREAFRDEIGPELRRIWRSAMPAVESRARERAPRLRIEVERPQRRPIRIALPAERATALDELIDDNLRDRIVGRGINLDAILEKLRAEKEPRREILDLEDEHGRFHVWIEEEGRP